MQIMAKLTKMKNLNNFLLLRTKEALLSGERKAIVVELN
uniref:Uncharacterized protein n=1 Tax=Anguilla anguilla TaxID=7936 RepID=A0A0E9THF1_ANGAN